MENVIIKFVADTSGLKPAIDQLELLGKISKEDAAAFARINDEQKEFIQNLNKSTTEFGKLNTEVEGLMAEIQAGVMEGFADHLAEVTKETKQAGTGFKSMRQELKELKAQIASGALGEKELREATKRAAELQDKIGDVNDKVKALASDTKRIDAVVTAFRGVAAAASVAAGAAALFGTENEKLTKTLAQAQGAMALLQGVQELANIATTEGALKTMVLDGAQKAAAISSRALGVTIAASTAAATAGISLLVAGLAYLVITMDDARESADDMNKALEGDAASRMKANDKRISMIKDGLEKELLVNKLAHQKELNELDKQFRNKTLSQEAYQNAVAVEDDYFLRKQQETRDKYAAAEAEKIRQHQERLRQIKKQSNDKVYQDQLRQIRDEIASNEILLRETADVDKKIKYYAEITRLKKAQIELDKSLTKNEKILQQSLLDDQLAAYQEFFNKYEDLSTETEANVTENTVLAWTLRLARIKKLQEDAAKQQKEQSEMWSKFAIDQAQVVSDTIFTINSNRRKEETDNIISALDEQREAELSNKNLTDAQRLQIEKRYRMQEARIKQQAWETQRQADISQAIINGALAVGKTLASLGFTPAGIAAAAAVGVQTAAQVAIIQSTPIPKFAEGTEFLVGKGTGTSDDNIAMLSHGERVVPAGINSDYFPALSAIHNRDVEPTFANNILTALANGTFDLAAQFQSKGNQQEQGIDYVKLDKIMAKNKASLNLSVDENGLKKWITKQNNVTEFRNTKLRLKN